MTHFDVLVIGAGQGGGPLASAFAKAGRRTALVEREHVGGTCVNEGCTPTKTMVASARVAHVVRRAPHFGIRASLDAVDLRRVRERKREIVERFRAGSERGLDDAGVTLVRGSARFAGERAIEVRSSADAGRLTADIVVLNTGLRPAMPPIRGLADVPSLTSTSIMELDTVPAHLLVLGGGYVGLEFAQMFRRFGSRVTVVEQGPQLLPREDGDIAEQVATLLRDDGIDVHLGTTAAGVRQVDGAIELSLSAAGADGATTPVRGSHLLVATGRRPNTDDLASDRAGVALDDHGYVRVNERLETTAPGVYAIGDVTGGPAFTHVSYDDFRILRTNLLDGGDASTAGRLLPYTVYLDPQLGRVGLTEAEARQAGHTIRVATMPMDRVARALEVDETRGVMKAVVDADTGRILGAAVLGIEGGEIATMFQLAMLGGLPYTALRDGVFAHPTIAESLNNLFRDLQVNVDRPAAREARTARTAR